MYARMIRTALLVLMCPGCLASAASAHGLGVLGSGRPEECAAELTAVFGRHTAFSAVAHVTESDQAASAARTKEMAYYVLDGKLRIETGVAKSSEFPGPLARYGRGKQEGPIAQCRSATSASGRPNSCFPH